MALGDFHQDSTDRTLDVQLALPPPPAKPPSTGKWNGWSAPLRGVVAGVAESAAFVADSVKGFGQTMAATGTDSAGGMFSTQSEAERRESELQRAKIKSEGVDTTSNVGTSLRNVSRDYRPDPATANLAERLTFDLTRFVTKAVGHTVAGAGVPGAVTLGTDEAMTTADDLAQQGVDKETRMKVGAVAGVAAAAGVVLPVAAPGSLLKTAGLWAVGGPGAFVAQQAATRELLQQADYGALAEQYDPLDPVGLAVSSLIPAGFAAHAVVRARGAAKAPGAVSEPVPASLTPEQVDAVMAHNLTAAQDLRDSITPAEAVAMVRSVAPKVEPVAPIKAQEPPVKVEAEAAPAGPLRQAVDELALDPEIAQRVDPLVEAVDAQIKPAEPALAQDPLTRSVESRAAEIEQTMPDMVVGADETGNPVTVRQELERIRREAIEGTDLELGSKDAALLEVAVNCALSTGVG